MGVKIWVAQVELLTESDADEEQVKKRIESAILATSFAKVCRVNKIMKRNSSSGSFRMNPEDAERLGLDQKKEG